MNAFLQPLLVFARRSPFLVFCLTLFLLLGIADYFLWQRQQAITVRYEEVQRNGETMFSALSSHSRIVAQLTTVEEALKRIEVRVF